MHKTWFAVGFLLVIAGLTGVGLLTGFFMSFNGTKSLTDVSGTHTKIYTYNNTYLFINY
jgi:hypothetical protein